MDDFLSPVLLHADPFTIGDQGAQVTLNPTQLINPNREAMLVDEFRFSFLDSLQNGSNGGTNGGVNLSTIAMRMTLGGIPLTNQFVSVPAIMPHYGQYNVDSTLVWHLARPMYVPPDVTLDVTFLRKYPTAFATNWSENGFIDTVTPYNFSVAGRSMPAGMEKPRTIFVPWACATSVYDGTVPYVSPDSDIGNPFDTVLHMDYLCGYQTAVWTMPNDTSSQNTGPLPVNITMQATLSSGKVLLRDPAPFLMLFPPNRPVMRMRAALQPKEFVSVVFDYPPPQISTITSMAFTTVGMTGYRAVQTPLGALP